MPKTVASALLSDIQSNVTTLATCLTITRKDGQVLRLTTHDTDLTVNGLVYKHDIPFSLSSIQSTTQLAVDNTQLTLFADEVNIFLADFKAALFEYAAVSIFQVNFVTPSNGVITMRTGWFGQIVFSENHIIQITITGLLKILDLEIGRIYSPRCDADLGDSRCKIAVQQSQIRSELNPMRLGDWVYYYDPALMTELTVVNPSFEADGVRTVNQSITGWTKTPGAKFQVRADSGTLGTFSVLDGTYILGGATLDTAPTESGLYQDIDIATQLGTTVDIDDGKVSILFSAGVLASFTVRNTWRLRVELMDADGVIIDNLDTRFAPLDDISEWREKACVLPLLPGTRTARLWLYSYAGATGSTAAANAADRVRLFVWDHTAGSPYSNVIHKVTRVNTPGTALATTYHMFYGSFEGLNVANANDPTIAAWDTSSGDWWQVVASAWSGTLTSSVDGARFLAGGDDGGSVSNLYSISQVHPLTTALSGGGWGLGTDRMLLEAYVATLRLWVGYGDTTSRATVTVEWMSDISTVIGSPITVVNNATGTVGWHDVSSDLLMIPGNATHVRVTLKARSPVGSGNAKVAFDNVRFSIFDSQRPKTSDPSEGFGLAATVFDTDIGDITNDNGILFKALGALVDYDVVASVISDKKEFTGTSITGADGTYETGPIRWISGDNAGLKNVIRKWTKGSKGIKLYFRTPHPIQVGDRFFYGLSCQRRFVEDCMLRFSNTINYRGFPYIPGAVITALTPAIAPVPPVLYQTLPASGPAAGGTRLRLTGDTRFGNTTQVKFGTALGTNLVHVDGNTIDITTPAHAAGEVNVLVSGTVNTGNGIYSFSNITVGTFLYT